MRSKSWVFLAIVVNLANVQLVDNLHIGDNWATSAIGQQVTAAHIADKSPSQCVTSNDVSKRLHSPLCKPRPHIVTVKLDKETLGKDAPIGITNPTHVETMKCTGLCNMNRECLPREVNYIQMPVSVVTVKNTDRNLDTIQQCVTTVVEYHESCTCKCNNKSKDNCNKQMQKYNEESCKCECIDSSYIQEYCRRRRNIWDESTCSCKCRRKPKCSTGSAFHPDKCICIKVEDDVHWKRKQP